MAGDVIGREPELAILDRFLDSIPAGPGALLLSGEAGIGKTTVWKEGLEGARATAVPNALVRSGRGGDASSPTPRSVTSSSRSSRRRFQPCRSRSAGPSRWPSCGSPSSGARADQRAVSLAVLGCLRSVATTTPVVVAIDDIQWMDLPSVRVLQFVVRRLKEEPVGVMAAVRGAGADEDPLGVAGALAEDRVHRVHVGPLSVDAIERVLRDKVGEGFPRTTLLSLHEMSGGNPFFAQEIGRALLRRGGEVAAGERPPIPERLQELVEDRLEGLPAETIEALEVVSALSAPTLDAIAAATDPSRGVDRRLDPAIENGVVEVVGDRLRFTHPLLASAVYQKIPPARRRELHARLATIVRDPEERARHLALSVEGPDVAVAAALEEAALLASSRGAPQSAAELWEMARRATPRDRGEDLVRRTHQAGVAHYESGDPSLARSVLEQAVDLSMAGPARARVLLDLGMGLAETEGWRGAWAVFEAARGEAGDDLALRALIEQNLGYAWLFRGDLEASERHARAALQLAEELQEPRVMAEAFQAYPFVEFLLGRGVDQELLDRGIALEGHMEGEFKSHVLRASFVVAQLLKFTDRLDEARRTFTELLGDAAAHGVETPHPADPVPPRRAGVPGGQLGCSHGARPGEQGGRPAEPHGAHVVGGPLRGGPGGSPSGAGRLGEAGSPRGAAGRRGGRRDPPPDPEPVGPGVPRAFPGPTRRGRCVSVQGRRARASDGRSGARLLPDRPGRGRGARRPRAARRGRGAPRPLRGGGQGPRPGLDHRHGGQVPGARVGGAG